MRLRVRRRRFLNNRVLWVTPTQQPLCRRGAKSITRRHHQVQRAERDSVYPDLAAGAARLTHMQPVEQDEEMRPLEFWLIRRVFTYMKAHRVKRNWLLLAGPGALDASCRLWRRYSVM
jgi:hypothetical protein